MELGNPLAPGTATPAPGPGADPPRTASGFVVLAGRTRAATIAVACVPALALVTDVLSIAFRDSIAAHDMGPVAAFLFLVDAAALALSYVGAAVFFSVWLHRAVRNLAALGRTDTTYSPAAAVSSFFIPVVNLARPMRVMKELWLASEPGVQSDGSGWQRNDSGTPLVDTWWGFFIASNVLGWWQPPASLRAFVDLGATALTAVAAFDCFRLMSGIAARQEAVAARLGFRSDDPYR